MKIWPIATAAVSAVLVVGGAGGAKPTRVRAVGADPVPVRMGVVLKALDNPFFLAIYEGARGEARRRAVRATVRSVPSSTDVAGEAAQLRALVASRRDCYVVNPITATNLVAPLRGVRRPIVNVDSPVDLAAAKRVGVRILTFIGTDDFAAGRLAGARMATLLRGRGDVALINGTADSINSKLRLNGFERGIRGSRVSVIARVNGDYDRTKAEVMAQGMLRAHPRLSGFFAANDEMALGVADAVSAAGRTGTVRIIGVDGIPEALDAVRAGSISATVSQYPYVMGQMAVEACAAARGATLPPRVHSPVALVTRGNVARAIAAFPKPVQRYPDPFSRLLRRRR